MISGDFAATSNEIIELDARSEKQILDQSVNEILELDCGSNKTSIGFQIKRERKQGTDQKICL